MKILIRGPVDATTGYGRDILGLTTALLDLGVNVGLWPTSVSPGIPQRVASLLTKPLAPPYDVVLWYAPPVQIHPWSLYGWGQVQLGWTMWERTPFMGANLPWWDPDDPDTRRGQVWSRRRLDRDTTAKGWLDALIVTCPMNRDAFAHIEKHLPIEVIPPGVDVQNYPQVPREATQGPVRFGWAGVPSARKNLPALLAAWQRFRHAHPDLPAELEIKTMGLGTGVLEAERLDGVTVHRDTWTIEQLAAWYGSLDCLVSTSRGEGMNKPAVEAMATGTPVLAPYWGGHVNWLRPECGYEVEHRVVECPFEVGTVDCEVDQDDLLRLLHEVTVSPDDRRRRGLVGANMVRSMFTWQRAAEEFLKLASRRLEDTILQRA